MSKKIKLKKQGHRPSELPAGAPGNEWRRLLAWGVMAGITLYCLLFLMTPFGPMDRQMQRLTPPQRFDRIDFFVQLLNLEYWSFAWFGEAYTFSFFAAFRIIVGTGLIAASAAGIGYCVLRLLGFTERMPRCERFVFSSAVGLSVLSTLMLVIGLCNGLATMIARLGFVCMMVIGLVVSGRWLVSDRMKHTPLATRHSPLAAWLAVPSLLILLFGGILPPVEYDVTSYHIPGAKLFYETGRIGFVPNNVYVNMPFAAEMFYVCGMVLSGDWYSGALVGKLLIAWCTVLAGLGIYCFAARLHSPQAGMIGFLLYVSLPWVSWVSTAGLIDGVFGMYLLLAIFALYLATINTERHGKFLYLAGYMAGCAAACKYTAVPFLVMPLCVFALICVCKQHGKMQFQCNTRVVRTLCFLALSIVLACGLWYGKNLVITGNPTYPLMHNLFGDRTGTWDAAKNARWQAAHSSTDFSAQQLARDAKTILFGSDWLAPVLVPLAVLPFLQRRQNRVLVSLALYLLFYLALWWLLTHRLERFWAPILPIVALLAGIGASSKFKVQSAMCNVQSSVRRVQGEENKSLCTLMRFALCALLLVFNTCYTFFPNALNAPGKYSRFGFGIEAARLDPMRVASPVILHFNANPPAGKLLLVGDAEVFDYNVPVLYNTCFDDTPFDAIFFTSRVQDAELNDFMRSSDEIRQRLKEADISHVIVNWSEITRFRSPGNYGYTSDLVQLEVFDRLVRLGILRRIPDIAESPDGISTLPGQVVYEVCR